MALNVKVISTEVPQGSRYQVAEGNGEFYAYDTEAGDVAEDPYNPGSGELAEGALEYATEMCDILNTNKSQWVLYNTVKKGGGSINSFWATDMDDLIAQVVQYSVSEQASSNEDRTDYEEEGWSAQNDNDYSQVVLFYPDGTIYVKHPYTVTTVS